jgi:hypothetical protein
MRVTRFEWVLAGMAGITLFFAGASLWATPANKSGLERHYDRFLAKRLAQCTTCHLPSENKAPESLEEFPHNDFGNRLRLVAKEFPKSGGKPDIAARLQRIAKEDSDDDGVPNEVEILLGHNPGDFKDKPDAKELDQANARSAEFSRFLASYRWRPFEPVQRPELPVVKNKRWVRNPIDAFITAEREARKLMPRPEATKIVLLRRVYLDVIGLTPTPAEQRAFLDDNSPYAYERLVDRLLDDPRYGERWGRHWMDVWRYSDWAGWSGGNQIRDSQPHIWRWRDWIIESLNNDKGYNRMVLEMFAADELAPEDTSALRATGYLVRNYKMLSREQWLEDTIKHSAQAFLGLTMGCAKCHDHMTDPISQNEYYQLRAIFEPHQVRTDRMPGELDLLKNGLVHTYDTATNARTFFFNRGDERKPDTNRVMEPGVPKVLGGKLQIHDVKLPYFTAHPDFREFVVNDTIAASERKIAEARVDLAKGKTNTAPEKIEEGELKVSIAEASHASLLAVLKAEKLEKKSEEWKEAAQAATAAQRAQALLEAKLKLSEAKANQAAAQTKLDEAQKKSDAEKAKKDIEKATKEVETVTKKVTDAEKALASAEEKVKEAPSTGYKARSTDDYPDRSTGRRLAFAQWLSDSANPLTARVAANHIWLRHFGRGIVPTPENFGRSGALPSHPQLLDWLAAECMANNWSMKHLHRLILTSATYRMASTSDETSAALDPDNIYLWRMPSRRMEAEIVRDNLLYVTGNLDSTMGGPEIDHKLGLTSKRRSVYLRVAPEKEVEFLKIFDGPSVTECYQRRPSVMPQQALALANSELALSQARSLAKALSDEVRSNDEFVSASFHRILARDPKRAERELCLDFLNARTKDATVTKASASEKAADPGLQARENLLLVLLNHNDFITIR